MPTETEVVQLEFCFTTDYDVSPPVISIKNNDQLLVPPLEIIGEKIISVTLSLPDDKRESGTIVIDRSNFDGMNHQILTLEKVYLDGINLAKICYQSRYWPEYPEPWISEQRDSGQHWPDHLVGVMSWGWNGRWELDYQTPVYTWLLENV